MAEFDNEFHMIRGCYDDKAAADGFELTIETDQQADTGGAQIGNTGKVKPKVMSTAADEFFQVALEMFSPVVVEAPFHFDFQSIGELLGDDFHWGARAARFRQVPQGW